MITYKLPSIQSFQGNIYYILGEVCRLLKQNGERELANELAYRVVSKGEATNYEEALNIISEYVHIEK